MPEAKARIQRLLPDCELDFVDTYADAALAVKSRRYSVAMIGVHPGESHIEELTRLIHDIQPEVRLLAVSAVNGRPLPELHLDRQRLEGPFDLSRDPLPAAARAALARIYEACLEP